MKRLMDTDPYTGIQTWHELVDGQTRIYYVPTRDLDPALDHCLALANDESYTKAGMKEDWWHYGHVPASVMLKWFVEEGVPFTAAEEYNKRLNRPEYSRLKVTHKHHGTVDKKIYLG